jgi:succinate dehydrogenase / fumarate reductase flavoprotein subunit
VGESGLGVYLDFADAIKRLGQQVIKEKYGNLIEMYQRITDENPYQTPMRIYPAVHYTMGGLWVDYNLMSTITGLLVAGEANFSDHGANRLGRARSCRGWPTAISSCRHARQLPGEHEVDKIAADHPTRRRPRWTSTAGVKFLGIKGKRTVDSFHRELRSAGTTAAWPGTRRASRARSRRSRGSARSSDRTSTSSARTRRSIPPSRRPAAWPTSWSSAS